MTANATNSTGIPEKRRLAPFPTKMLCRRDIVFAFLYCSSTRQTMNTTGGRRVGRRQEWARWKKKNKANKQTTKNRKGDEGETIAWTEEIFIKHKKKIDARKLTFFLFQLFTKPNKRRMMKWQKKIIIRLGWRQTVKKWRKKKEIENNGSLSGSLKSKV